MDTPWTHHWHTIDTSLTNHIILIKPGIIIVQKSSCFACFPGLYASILSCTALGTKCTPEDQFPKINFWVIPLWEWSKKMNFLLFPIISHPHCQPKPTKMLNLYRPLLHPKRAVAHPKKAVIFGSLKNKTTWSYGKVFLMVYSVHHGVSKIMRLLSYIKVSSHREQ